MGGTTVNERNCVAANVFCQNISPNMKMHKISVGARQMKVGAIIRSVTKAVWNWNLNFPSRRAYTSHISQIPGKTTDYFPSIQITFNANQYEVSWNEYMFWGVFGLYPNQPCYSICRIISILRFVGVLHAPTGIILFPVPCGNGHESIYCAHVHLARLPLTACF